MNFTSLDNIDFSSYIVEDFTKVLDIASMRSKYKDLLNDLDARASAAFEKVFNNEDGHVLNQVNIITNPISPPTSTTAMSPLLSSDEDEEHFAEEETGHSADDPTLVDTPHIMVETQHAIIKVETPDDVKLSLYSFTDGCPTNNMMGGAPECSTSTATAQCFLNTIPRALKIEKKTQSISGNIVSPLDEIPANNVNSQTQNNKNFFTKLPKEALAKKVKRVSFEENLTTVFEYDDDLDNVTPRNVSIEQTEEVTNNSINKHQATNKNVLQNSTSNNDNNQQVKQYMTFTAAAALVAKPKIATTAAVAVAIKPKTTTTTTTKEYTLPDITFEGIACDHTELSTTVFTLTLILEGQRVIQFIQNFERQVQKSGLNLDKHWHGLLEICFKKTRTKNMKLYLWFTKRLYDGQSWYHAREIIKRHFGFESPFIKQSLQKKFEELRYNPNCGESFGLFYEKFRDLAPACIDAKIVKDDWVLICTIITCASDKIQREYFANIITEYYVKRVSTEDLLETTIKSLPVEHKYYYLNLFLNEQGTIESQLSWREFDLRVRKDVHQVTAKLEQQEHEEKARAEAAAAAAEEKKIEMKRQNAMRKKMLQEKRQQEKLEIQQLAAEKQSNRELRLKKRALARKAGKIKAAARIKSLKEQGLCTFCGVTPHSLAHHQVCEARPKIHSK